MTYGMGGVGFGPPDRHFLFAPASHPGVSGTVTPDLSLGNIWQIFMPAGNITVANPINMNVGDELILVFIQDSIGGRTVAFGNALYRSSAFALSSGANAIDSVMFAFSPQLSWGQVAAAALNLVNV